MIEGNTLRLDLKVGIKEIEGMFKYGGKFFTLRRLLANFGYNDFKKALKLGVYTFDEYKLNSFTAFFTAVQKAESSSVLEAGSNCPKCGLHNDIGVTFCVSCGTPVDTPMVNECQECGFVVPPEAKFCPGCGAPRN